MSKLKPIPTEVFKHIKYGNGAKPGARLKVNEITYILEPGENFSVKAKKYVPDNWESKPVKLSDIPVRSEENWDTYFTNES